LVILSNVPGLLRDFPDESTLIARLPARDARAALERYAQGRMKKKVLGAVEALNDGVGKVILADGRSAHPVRKAMAGSGTTIE
jgi:acetylglutamate/LysW-gamma-L-alpha-aminoadipate kinase